MMAAPSALPLVFLPLFLVVVAQEEQRGVLSSLTHLARGLGYAKLTGLLSGPHMNGCLELVHDPQQNQASAALCAPATPACVPLAQTHPALPDCVRHRPTSPRSPTRPARAGAATGASLWRPGRTASPLPRWRSAPSAARSISCKRSAASSHATGAPGRRSGSSLHARPSRCRRSTPPPSTRPATSKGRRRLRTGWPRLSSRRPVQSLTPRPRRPVPASSLAWFTPLRLRRRSPRLLARPRRRWSSGSASLRRGTQHRSARPATLLLHSSTRASSADTATTYSTRHGTMRSSRSSRLACFLSETVVYDHLTDARRRRARVRAQYSQGRCFGSRAPRWTLSAFSFCGAIETAMEKTTSHPMTVMSMHGAGARVAPACVFGGSSPHPLEAWGCVLLLCVRGGVVVVCSHLTRAARSA